MFFRTDRLEGQGNSFRYFHLMDSRIKNIHGCLSAIAITHTDARSLIVLTRRLMTCIHRLATECSHGFKLVLGFRLRDFMFKIELQADFRPNVSSYDRLYPTVRNLWRTSQLNFARICCCRLVVIVCSVHRVMAYTLVGSCRSASPVPVVHSLFFQYESENLRRGELLTRARNGFRTRRRVSAADWLHQSRHHRTDK